MLIFYGVPAKKEKKWKYYFHILQNKWKITQMEKTKYKIEIPVLELSRFPKIQRWQEKRQEKKLEELLQEKKGRIVLAKNLKSKWKSLQKFQIKENLKLPLLYKILDFYLKVGNSKAQEIDLYILTHTFSKEVAEVVRRLASKYRSVNIVSDEVIAYNNLADKLYENNTQLITVSNNKKSAIRNAKLIVNYDFSIEELLLYKTDRDSTIIHLQTTMNRVPIGFCRLVINDIVLEKSEKDKVLEESMFSLEDMVSSQIFLKETLNEKEEALQNLKISIKALKGLNGIIQPTEIQNLCKALDKIGKLH